MVSRVHGLTRSLLHVVSILFLLPLLISWLIARHSFEKQSLCIVSRSVDSGMFSTRFLLSKKYETTSSTGSSNRDLFGIYKVQKAGKSYVRVKSGYHDGARFHRGAWPSLLSLNYRALSSISLRDDMKHVSQQPSILLQRDKERFCLHSSNNTVTFCSSIINTSLSKTKNVVLVPPSGLWTAKGDEGTMMVSCHTPPNATSNDKEGRKKKQKKTLNHIINRPATTVLLLLNCFLAYRYWNYRVHPSSVAIVYNKMATEGTYELWRAFSGTFAHFEPLHLGFNMMSLYSLGVVEDLYGPIFYGLVSLVMIIYTVGFMIVVFHYQATNMNNVSVLDTKTVGYSGILFVWMVIATLEQGRSCPIPVLNDLCFNTLSLGLFRFNLAPVAQLIFIQMFMPRASFVGHLGGIVSGYLMHWGAFPLILLDPTTVIGLSSLLFSWNIKGSLKFQSARQCYDDESPVADENTSSRILCRSQSLITGAVVMSAIFYDEILLSHQACIATMFFAAIQLLKRNLATNKEAVDSLLILFSISAVLVIINDAGTIGVWITMKRYVQSTSTFPIGVALSCMALRCIANLFALSIAAFFIPPVDGFVRIIFGYLLDNLQPIGNFLISREPAVSTFQAFQGSGRSLRGTQEV